MTLITCGNSEGNRRCDERCYGATGGTCDCVCGGANHGKGLAQALANTQEMAEDILEKHGYAIEINQACQQADLFVTPSFVMKKKGQTPWE